MRHYASLTALSALLVACSSDPGTDADATDVTDVTDATMGDTSIVFPPGCSDPLSILAQFPGTSDCAAAGLGATCRYPALACAPGAKPDITCTCTANTASAGAPVWRCTTPYYNCLPFATPGAFALGTRPYPAHRASAVACADPAAEPRAAICDGRVGGTPSTCAANGDCAPDEVCLLEAEYDHGCNCYGAACLADADCGVGRVCQCGVVTSGATCHRWPQDCGHRCVAAACTTDADCGPGGLCAGSRTVCGGVERYVCNDPAHDACSVDDDCASQLCRYDDDAGWHCVDLPICY